MATKVHPKFVDEESGRRDSSRFSAIDNCFTAESPPGPRAGVPSPVVHPCDQVNQGYAPSGEGTRRVRDRIPARSKRETWKHPVSSRPTCSCTRGAGRRRRRGGPGEGAGRRLCGKPDSSGDTFDPGELKGLPTTAVVQGSPQVRTRGRPGKGNRGNNPRGSRRYITLLWVLPPR